MSQPTICDHCGRKIRFELGDRIYEGNTKGSYLCGECWCVEFEKNISDSLKQHNVNGVKCGKCHKQLRVGVDRIHKSVWSTKSFCHPCWVTTAHELLPQKLKKPKKPKPQKPVPEPPSDERALALE